LLGAWPVERPADWLAFVNEPQTAAELAAIRRSAARGTPFGDDDWRDATSAALGLGHTLRPPGRPAKRPAAAGAAGGAARGGGLPHERRARGEGISSTPPRTVRG
jgi:hypothetical protein